MQNCKKRFPKAANGYLPNSTAPFVNRLKTSNPSIVKKQKAAVIIKIPINKQTTPIIIKRNVKILSAVQTTPALCTPIPIKIVATLQFG